MRILLVWHGESFGNVDKVGACTVIPVRDVRALHEALGGDPKELLVIDGGRAQQPAECWAECVHGG